VARAILNADKPATVGQCGSSPRPYGVLVLTVTGGEIAAVTGFPDLTLFARLGLIRNGSG